MTTQTTDPGREQHALANGTAHPQRPEPQAYRVADACYVLGIGRTSLYELVNAGQLKLIKLAGRTLVPRSEIKRLTSVDRAA